MLAINDPVGTGLVTSLARPGGHTTGMATLNEDLSSKLLEFQRAVLPKTVIAACSILQIMNSSKHKADATLA
jgi:putative ABC transport system substrate-binding protein